MTTYGSVCSGIEAATVAWHPLGMRAGWLAEIEAFPCAVLAHHYPTVPNLGDMTKIASQVLAGTVAAPDVLVGGTPCQAFSVAGMRAGLADPRGALTIKYVELADAIDHVRQRAGLPECATVWENVPGVLSDKGNAFGCFLGALVGESDALVAPGGKWTNAGCVYGPRRAVAWRVLDAQYFGLAQRRKRVFVVASARAGFDPASVLFESEGVRRDHPPRRGSQEDLAPTVAGGARKRGGYSADDIPMTAGSLRAQAQSSHREDLETFIPVAYGGNNQSGPVDVATARNACASASASGRMDFESETFVVVGTLNATAKAAGSATSQDAESGLLVVHGTQDPCVDAHTAHALGRNHGQENAVLSYSTKLHHTSSCGSGKLYEEYTASLDACSPPPALLTPSQVRRLTPVECERLQGFPDNHTLIPWDGWRKLDVGETPEQCIADGMKVRQAKKSKAWYVCDADGPRYKAIGNSKAVPVVRWIGRRLLAELGRCA